MLTLILLATATAPLESSPNVGIIMIIAKYLGDHYGQIYHSIF